MHDHLWKRHQVPDAWQHGCSVIVCHGCSVMVHNDCSVMVHHACLLGHGAPYLLSHSVPCLLSHGAPYLLSHDAPCLLSLGASCLLSLGASCLLSLGASCLLSHGGIHVEDIFQPVSLDLFLIISWAFRILAHEEDQYTDFLSITLKLTKDGPRSSGTPFLVFHIFGMIKISILESLFF